MAFYIWVVLLAIAAADVIWFTYAGPQMTNVEERAKWTKATWFQACLLNFLGCLIGWLALFFVIDRVILHGSLHDFAVWDALGVLVAFLGVTGNLPMFMLQMVQWRTPGG
ncbi:MAG: hypothetical protein ACLQFW_03975 [Xanthobacteraceae bacterium]